jgi:hypothetical protein
MTMQTCFNSVVSTVHGCSTWTLPGGFDPLSKLQGLAEELQMAVTPAGCFKQ